MGLNRRESHGESMQKIIFMIFIFCASLPTMAQLTGADLTFRGAGQDRRFTTGFNFASIDPENPTGVGTPTFNFNPSGAPDFRQVDPATLSYPVLDTPTLTFGRTGIPSCDELHETADANIRNILAATCGIPDGSAVAGQQLDFNQFVNDATSGYGIAEPVCLECDDNSLAPRVSIRPRARPTPPGVYQHEDVAAEEACNIEGMDEQAKQNCIQLLNEGSVPNEALIFALKGLKRNATSFNTNQCFDTYEGESTLAGRMRAGHFSMLGMREPSEFANTLESGIPNKCTMMINDYDDLIETHGGAHECKAAMYYIDLCGETPTVDKSYSYVGYGTCKNNRGFRNESGQGTTLLGFGVTGNQTFAFGKSDAPYNRIRRELGGTVPATPIFGLQNSNNGNAVDYKYLHVGAYTSAGCPSIDPSKAQYIYDMAEKGPSVIVGYKSGEMEAFETCEDSTASSDAYAEPVEGPR